MAPTCSFQSPKALAACCALPASVLAISAFMSPTLAVMISAKTAARCVSLPNLSCFFWASEKVMPTRCRAVTLPCSALPKRLPMLTASCPVALSPFCCTNRLFMAGISVSTVWRLVAKVAICCAPISCTSSPTTPSDCCAEVSSRMAAMSPSVAPIRSRMTVANLVSASTCTALAVVYSRICATSVCSPLLTFWNACCTWFHLTIENDARRPSLPTLASFSLLAKS